MLEQMRRGAQSLVAKLLFAILVASFAIWGVADVFRGWGRGSIAKVGNTAISADEFQRAYQNELDRFSREAKKRITAEQGRAIGLDRRVMAQLVGGAAIEAHAKELGLALSDKTLIDGIQSDPDFKGPDGKFSKQGFDGLLRQIGLSERGFLNLRRKDELRTQIIGAFVKSQTVPKPLLDAMQAYSGETRVIEWIKIDPDEAVTVAEPDEAKLKQLFEAGKSKYMTPEYRKVQVLQLTVDDLKKQITVADADVAAAYETTKDGYNTPEQRRVQQIAFKDRASGEVALKSLKDGSKTFGDVAKDAGAKDTDVDLGLISKKALIDPKIADVAFTLEKDKISDVVEGRFATVIVRVTQIEPGVTRTFDDVKDQVRDKLATEKAKSELQTKHDEVEDNRSAGKSLPDIAEAMKLTLLDIAAVDGKGMGPDGKPAITVPDAQKIIGQAFAPDPGTDDQGLELATGGYAWVNVVSTEPPKERAFEAVKDDVKSNYIFGERQRLITELATKLVERVNGGEPMSAIEAAAKGKVEKTEPITRNTEPQGLSQSAVAQAFALAKGRASHAPSSDKNTEIVFQVSDVTAAPPATAAQLDTMTRELENDFVNQTLSEYTDALKERLGASVNDSELRGALGVSDQ